MSYNAALRAINMGFTQVYWYRGGVEAWRQAQQLAASMQGGQHAPGGYQQAPGQYQQAPAGYQGNQPGGW